MQIIDTGRCAIFTKYMGPTNFRGGRIKAWAKSGGKLSATIGYPHELSQPEAHAKAAQTLLDKMGWTCGILYQADAENGCVFVMDR